MTTERQTRFEHLLERAVETRLATIDRRALLRAGAAAGAATLAFGTIPLGAARSVAAQEDPPFAGPIDVLNFALTLEHIEAAFYRDGLATIGEGGITALGFQPGVFEWLGVIGQHEADHVATLTDVITQLGGEPVAEASYDFGYADAAGFLQVAQALEDTGVSAYNGAAQYLMEEDALLTAALTIHGVEARHAAYVAILNGGSPYPDAFNPVLTPAETLEIATPFIR